MTYRVIRKSNRNGSESNIARYIETLNEAGELALRLTVLQETDLGGVDEFYAEPD
jgi:hypothetical protein